MATTNRVLNGGTYSNSNQTTAPWQPPVCNYVTIVLNQINTPAAGDTATISGTIFTSPDNVTWADSGEYSSDFGFVDTTVRNKNGNLEVPPSASFGVPYAKFLKAHVVVSGTVVIQSIDLVTN